MLLTATLGEIEAFLGPAASHQTLDRREFVVGG
jgi:hypothetical protein